MEHLRAGDVSEKAALAMSPLAIRTIPTHAAITIANGGIASLVALATYGAPDDQEKAAVALATYGQKNAATTAVIEAGGVAPIVALAENGTAAGMESAARAFEHIARSSSGRSAIVNNGGISSLVKLLNLEEVAGHVGRLRYIRVASVRALAHLACDDAHEAAVTAAGAWKALVKITAECAHKSETCKTALRALANLGLAPLHYHSQLQSKYALLSSKNASLQRRLNRYEGNGVIDLTGDGDGAAPEHRDKRLRTELDQASKARLVEVKLEATEATNQKERAEKRAADETERADFQGTNAMYLTTQKSELQQLVSDAANALLDAEVPTNEVSDEDAPFYYMLESHRDDNKQTLPWNPYAGRPMTLAEGIHWILNSQIAGGCRRRR